MNTDAYKEKLLAEKKKIEEELLAYKGGLGFAKEDNLEEDEEADEAEEFATYLGIKDALQKRLNHIEAALQRISSGRYGVCLTCGNPIEEQVLSAEPESSLCSSCKTV